jgi:anion transporter
MALLSGEPRSATIITVKPTSLWRLSREDWEELIEKHATWLLQFCATLSKRLSHLDRQYSTGREAFNSLAEEFYTSRSAVQQQFFRHASLLSTIDLRNIDELFQAEGLAHFLSDLDGHRFPLIRHIEQDRFEFHNFFRDFLQEKLLVVDGKEAKQRLHAMFAKRYEAMGDWQQAIHHAAQIPDWREVIRILRAQNDNLLADSPLLVKNTLEAIPQEYFIADPGLIDLKGEALTQLGDLAGAYSAYDDVLSQKAQGSLASNTIVGYRRMAENLARRKDYGTAINYLRSALHIVEQDDAATQANPDRASRNRKPLIPALPMISGWADSASARSLESFITLIRSSSLSRWLGGIGGLAIWGYLWFGQPDIGLDANGNKLLGLLSLTLIYWIFWVLPDYAVALIFGLGLILTRLASPDVVMGGFASTTWFMTLGVLGLGAAITGSGLFYRFSLHLVRCFPLNFYGQILATGVMGVVVMALIPQQTARTSITSQMLVNLSESLGYRTPSKASTGLFAASFLGLGQLGFLFLTGSTTSLIAWGLLPADVRVQFTWGYWFIAALPPTAIVIGILLVCIVVLYKPEVQPVISYKMVQTQLDVLGPLSRKEWISQAVLCFTLTGWLTTSYHGIDSAWIALVAFVVLIATGVLESGTFRKAIDWELLVYMGVTLSIPALLTGAGIDRWLVELLSPIILPFQDNPGLFFVVIALLTYALKLFFTSFLTVVTLSVALLPLSVDIGMSPWIIAMIVLMASEVWFFPFQVDWHTLAYSTSEKKGFSYPLMCRVNPFYAIAYIIALIAAIPYWRYLGLMG